MGKQRRDALRALTTGSCSWPITIVNDKGETKYVPCKSRYEAWCPSCANKRRQQTYQRAMGGIRQAQEDTYALYWITLTPHGSKVFGCPSHRATSPILKCPCTRPHNEDDPLIGTPLNPSRFNYTAAAQWNLNISRLWARTITLLRQQLKLPRSRYHEVQYLRVVEWQQRGLAHIHALIRIERNKDTTAALLSSIASASVKHSENTITWGKQSSIEAIEATDTSRAGYIAKYSSKHARDMTIDSKARGLHYARIGAAVQREIMPDKQLSEKAKKRITQSIGLRGSVITASHGWEKPFPKTTHEPANTTWQATHFGYEGKPPIEREDSGHKAA